MNREGLTEKILDVKREKRWTWKHVTDEIGGIMSAIDFDLKMERVADPKGVQLVMSGKFLSYRYYENEQGVPESGHKSLDVI